MELLENLRENDLLFLVTDTILIDEFESKFSTEKYIVVCFVVKTKEALEDLRNFIQVSSSEEIFIVDGLEFFDYEYDSYLLFVEFERNIYFPVKLIKVLEKVSFLCGIKNWKMKIHNVKNIFSVNETNLKKYISFALIDKNKGKQLKECFENVGIDYSYPFTRYFSYKENVYRILTSGLERDLKYYFSDFFEENSKKLIEANMFSSNPYLIDSDNFIIVKNTGYYPITIIAEKST